MARPNKGWMVKHTFSSEFVNCLENLYTKYGEDVFCIQGIGNMHMDICEFSSNFFSKSASNVADVSADGNANVREKNIMQYNYENNKALMKLESLYMMFKWVTKQFSLKDAETCLEKVVSGELFINDLTSFNTPYCYAFDLRVLLENGLNFYNGNMTVSPPKRSDSFLMQVIQATAYISNQIVGAASYPDLFCILDWFYRKEFGNDYVKKLKLGHDNGKSDPNYDLWYRTKNQFQNLIYSFNWPFRGCQSAFVNLSVMDKGFMKSLFNNYMFPDYSKPDIDSTIELSKLFFEYFTDIQSREGIFTFPVMTLAISIDDNKNYIDSEFVDWAAKIGSKKACANIFVSKANAFSSCCRLRNSFEKVADAGYMNSFGTGGLSIGSHRVVGLNLARLAFLKKDNLGIIEENIDYCWKILYSHRKLIEHMIEGGFLPLYTNKWINLKRQYSTFGFVGGSEFVKNQGFDIKTEEGLKSLTDLLQYMELKITKYQEEKKDEKIICNIEQIPAETMAVRLCQLDTLLGFNPKKYELYSNQYVPLIEDCNIYDRFKIQGKIDGLTSGGAILHLNVEDEKLLTPEQFKMMIELSRKTDTIYWAVNYCYSECVKRHYSIGKHEECPICQSNIKNIFTRVVGFLTPTKSWIKLRREYEFPRRVFYSNDRVENEVSQGLKNQNANMSNN